MICDQAIKVVQVFKYTFTKQYVKMPNLNFPYHNPKATFFKKTL